MNNLVIRKALPADEAILLQLEQEVVKAERPFNADIKPQNAIYYDIDKLLTDDVSYLIVAEINGQIIGTGYAQIRDSKKSLIHDKHSYLGFMYVSPEQRGQGINKLIMENLIEWSKRQGVYDFYLDVYDGNDSAIKAYEKVGFEKSLVEMKMHISE